MMQTPIDQSNRDQFVFELETNFSVVAAAGSGKTRAITDRIGQIAKHARAEEWLPQLVVVAFTNRAADEMQQRARAEILQSKHPEIILPAFNRAFFGTIHSFCVRLLEAYGHHLGLPPQFDLIADDEELWNEFVQQQATIGRCLSDESQRELLRHVSARQLMELARKEEFAPALPPSEKCPDADFSKIYQHRASGSAMQTIPRLQDELKAAEKRFRHGNDFIRWPVCESTAREFTPKWREAFAPLRGWIDQASLVVAAEVQRDYRQFRIEHGALTYDDQIALALALIQQPEAVQQIREQNFRIILDEAQDTDPNQFSILLEIARPAEGRGEWLETKQQPPRPGHFCMVGDFQQSIYRDRADLSKYRRIHETLVDTGAAEALKFSVTFRLDQKQIDFVNETFREILNNEQNQVEFVKLNPRPQVLPGQVVRLNLAPANLPPDRHGKVSDARKATEEARQIAQWLRATGLKKLRANCWREVAILCPRKDWLQTLRRGLREVGFAVQVQSEKEWKGDSPAYAWLTALFTIVNEPNNGYEIAGVLREVFGISDHELALFSWGDGSRFQIATVPVGSGVVVETLRLLSEARMAILQLPLFDAANELVRRTKLRERLQSLPSEDFEDLDSELDALLAAAGASESENVQLSEFVELLRLHFSDPREIRPSAADAIQLITSQKAKGSEWQAVVVPFLGREVKSASPRYPKILRDPGTDRPTVVFDKFDIPKDIHDALDLEERQEMERLLYVALTRAKHTLVLVFDRDLFAKSKGQVHSSSQITWLKSEDTNKAAFDAIELAAEPCPETVARYEKSAGSHATPAAGFDRKIAIDVARSNATQFIQKLNPSDLPSEEIEIEQRWDAGELAPEKRVASPALRYGLWWHEFVAQLNWSADASKWNELFKAEQTISPDPARSKREWKLLLNHLEKSRDFNLGKTNAHAEMPFLWRIDEHRCLEGIVDLALIEPSEKKLFVLDWKTDRVPPDSPDTLRKRYLSQLAAYWKAIGEITKFEIGAAIYSTAAGTLIRYNPDELAKEWARLEKLPVEDFATKVVQPIAQARAESRQQLELF